jgi:hypothetical protein
MGATNIMSQTCDERGEDITIMTCANVTGIFIPLHSLFSRGEDFFFRKFPVNETESIVTNFGE